ncbi:hypothetical protein CMV24_16600 [Pseudomonas plecoglossicida]|uniref:Uncharacterized protein n=1 Tax=Pseudomonas plecoglossicida TaxID=70775 RepID=A0A2A3M2L3_PSEDL|nr:hypothetical protein CMV24_16600 [Pseudomonas plecoglossicida]
MRGDERRCVSGFLWRSVPASSRVNPLPQVPHRVHGLRHTCGSGFTREEAGTGNGSIPQKKPAHAGHRAHGSGRVPQCFRQWEIRRTPAPLP